MKKTALIVVDVQNDFVENGSLAVAGGTKVASDIADYINNNKDNYDLIITTQDWHIEPEGHFSDTPDFIDTWPPHCVALTDGAKLLTVVEETLAKVPHDRVYKGEYTPAYSGFQGASGALGEEPDVNIWTATLHQILTENKITDLHIVGIAYDYCVKQTALDGVEKNYAVEIIRPLTASIHNDPATDEELTAGNVTIREELPEW